MLESRTISSTSLTFRAVFLVYNIYCLKTFVGTRANTTSVTQEMLSKLYKAAKEYPSALQP